MNAEVVRDLSPGVKELVVWLNGLGFETCDSGDGTNFGNGMGCAVPFPMVAILSKPEKMIDESLKLRELLIAAGVKFEDGECEDENHPSIQATYNPVDGQAVIVLYNVLSRDVGL